MKTLPVSMPKPAASNTSSVTDINHLRAFQDDSKGDGLPAEGPTPLEKAFRADTYADAVAAYEQPVSLANASPVVVATATTTAASTGPEVAPGVVGVSDKEYRAVAEQTNAATVDWW